MYIVLYLKLDAMQARTLISQSILYNYIELLIVPDEDDRCHDDYCWGVLAKWHVMAIYSPNPKTQACYTGQTHPILTF